MLNALLSELVVCFSLIQTRTEAGEGNIYHLVHGGARLQAGTTLSKAIHEMILPLTELSNSSFLSDRLLHTQGVLLRLITRDRLILSIAKVCS